MLPTEPPISPSRAELTVESHGGQVVVVKRARPAGAPRLRHEADVLARAQGPGVVRLVACGDDADGATWMTTAWVGTHTLATVALAGADHVADLAAAVAHTVADLHDRGIVHGSIAPAHVVIGADGRPVLVGFGRGVVDGGAGHRGDAGERGPLEDEPTRSDDVEALGRLALDLLGRLEVPARARRRADALADAARTASNPDRWARPSARRLAAMLAGAEPVAAAAPTPEAPPVPTSPTPPSGAPSAGAPPSPAPPSAPSRNATIQLSRAVSRRAAPAPAPAPARRRWLLVAGVVATLLVTAAVAGAVWSRSTDTAASDTSTSTPVDDSMLTTTTAATTPASVPPPTATPSTSAPPSTTGPPDGPRTVVQPGGSLAWEGRTYELGDPGDEVTVGDFACTGRPMAVVLRPSSGEVFAFRDWAAPGVDVHAGVASTVPPGSHLEPSAIDERGCAPLTVRLPGGDVATVVLAAAPSGGNPSAEGGA